MRIKISHYWLFLLLFFVSQAAWAHGFGIKPATDDLFGQMLEQIVGNKVIPAVAEITKAQVDSWTGSIVSILSWINAVVLFIGGVLASYTIFGSIIKTARSGEVMGNWNEHTIPVRTLMGAAVLLPVPGFAGLSAIQIIVIWLFGFVGIGIADTGWNVIVPHIETNALGTLVVPRQNIRNLAGSVLTAQVCERSVNATTSHLHIGDLISRSGPTPEVLADAGKSLVDNPAEVLPGVASIATGYYVPSYDSYVWGTTGASIISQFMPLMPAAGLTDVCGRLTWESNLKYAAPLDGAAESTGSQLRGAIYKATTKALPTLLSSLSGIATTISQDQTPSSAAWNNAINAYDKALTTAAKARAQQVFAAGIKRYAASAQKYGFATAGEWFWKINQWNQAAEEALNQSTSGNFVSPSWAQFAGKMFSSHYDAEMKRVHDFVDSAHSTGLNANGQLMPTEGGPGTLGALFSKAGVDTVEGIMEAPGGENPIEHVQAIGTAMEVFAGAVFAAALLGIGAGAGVDHSAAGLVGGAALGKLGVVVGELAMHIAMWIFGIGYLLSFFIPLIPYLIWTITLLTTAILFVEMVAAAPIWAVMHMHPEGHEFFGYGSTGYLLATSIVFRPLLMLVGFMAGTGLTYAFAWILNATLGNAVLSAMTNSGGGFLGPMDFLGSAILYAAFLVIATWKSYELIYLIPDKVMRWANAQGAQTDDAHLKSALQSHGEGTQGQNIPGKAIDTHGVVSGNPITGAKVPGAVNKTVTPQG
ncbi:DotA/TraY family protein [Acidithiobacillus sp. M4-SHS-6]|uniref:DotA/TraY family protein n=1 Tax=Acidithiobacillus sp. M4-SHS-6 TaxID=3383024 RepID=UPI0039BE5A82